VTYVHDSHLPESNTPNATSHARYESSNYLESSAGVHYSCSSKTNLNINNDVVLTTTDFKYKAFNEKGDINLETGSVNQCAADDESTSSIVPIAVGAALAGLVVIVLIAYLIGRKRSRKTGYETV
jgi:lysosomal-associated membrane protein 1/2